MNKFWHVARTYWRRPRFWIFGGWYLLITLLPTWREWPLTASFILFMTGVSGVFASLLAAFVALHVRRQFGTPQAHLTPHFAWPHLTVAALFTLAIWVIVPWIVALRAGVPPVAMISLHTVAAMVTAAVIFWPKMSVLLAVAPLLLLWPAFYSDRSLDRVPFVEHFVAGENWFAYAGLLAVAILSYPLAAWRLMRLSDVAVATSDDFTIEPPGTALASNPATDLLHAWRDAHIEWQLARPARWFRAIQRRRTPSAPSWPQMASFAALVLALMGPAWWAGGEPIGAWVALAGGTTLMVFAPYSYWRFRAGALVTEMMRPATREAAMRDVMLAMAGDFLVWTAVATVTIVLGYGLLLVGRPAFEWIGALFHVVFLWCLAVWSLGIALATLRLRYWMPLFAVLLIASVLGVIAATTYAVRIVEPSPPHSVLQFLPLVSFPGGFLAIGLVLCAGSYRRWRNMDVT